MDRFILEELKPGASALSTCWGFGTLVGAIASAAASQYFPRFRTTDRVRQLHDETKQISCA